MCKSNRIGPLVAALVMLSGIHASAAELDVRIEPENRALRENIENYIGDLGDRDARELLRYSRVAQSQAEKALQALGYYRSRIRTDVREGEEPALVLRVRTGEPVKLRNITVRLDGPAAEFSGFRVAERTLRQGDVLNHGRYEEVKQQFLNQASRFGYFDGRFTQQRLAVDPRENVADVELVFDSGPRYRLGDVRFEGDSPFDDDLLARMVPFETDTPYDSELIAELSQALQSSGYFEGVRVDANPSGANQQRIPVSVALTTRKPRTFGFGLGYSTDAAERLFLVRIPAGPATDRQAALRRRLPVRRDCRHRQPQPSAQGRAGMAQSAAQRLVARAVAEVAARGISPRGRFRNQHLAHARRRLQLPA